MGPEANDFRLFFWTVARFASESESSSGLLGKQNRFGSWPTELVVLFLCFGTGLHINSSAEKSPGRRLQRGPL